MTTPNIKSTGGLRTFLLDQMEGVAEGNLELDRAKGVANLAQQVYNTMLMEVKMAKARADLGDDAIKSVAFDE